MTIKLYLLIALILFRLNSSFAWNGPTHASPANNSYTNGGVTIDWNSITGSLAYQYEIDTSLAFNSPVKIQGVKNYINSSSGNSDTQFTMVNNFYYAEKYYWRVRAYVAGDTSAWSSPWTYNTPAYGPALISPATATANIKAGVTLDWDSHYYVTAYDWQADTVPAFNSPVLRHGTNLYSDASSGNPDTQVTLGNLYYGKTYYWRVRSRNAVDTSMWTNAWTFKTTQYGPTLFSPATATANIKAGVTLDWDSHYYVTAYDWQADTVPAFNSPVLRHGTNLYSDASSGNPDTQVTLGNLYYGKTYYWRVRSRNAVDTSLWTNAWTFKTTQNGPALFSPATTTANIKAGVTLDWDSHYYVTAYDWQADTVPAFNSPVLRHGTNLYSDASSGNPDTQVTLGNLYYGKTYYWRVRSRNAVDTSLWTNAWTFKTTQNGPALFSPATTTANIKAGVTLDWDSHYYVTAYDWQADTVPAFNSPVLRHGTNLYSDASSGNPDTQVTLGNLYYGKTYYWRVRSRNAVDTSLWTNAWTFKTTQNGPALFSPATTTANIKAGVTLDWDSHYYVTAYDWQADTVPAFNSSVLRHGTNLYSDASSGNPDTQVTLGNLYYGKTYYWRVRSRNAVDTSMWTNAWTFNTTQNGPTLISPANGQLNISTSGTSLDWDSQYYVQKYQLEADTCNLFNTPYLIRVDNSYINTSNGNSDTQHSLTTLPPNTIIYWRVRSINSVDTSDWTPTWAFSTGKTTIITPTTPLLVAPFNNSVIVVNSALIDWNAVAGIGYYDFQVDTVSIFNTPLLITGTTNSISSSNSNYDTEYGLTNLIFGKSYYWRVRTRTSSATSAWSSTWKFTVSNATSVMESEVNPKMLIYPNPLSTQTVLQTDYIIKNATLTVGNSFGQTVKEIKNISGQKVVITRDNLPSGLYFIRLTEENKIIAIDKLVIVDN